MALKFKCLKCIFYTYLIVSVKSTEITNLFAVKDFCDVESKIDGCLQEVGNHRGSLSCAAVCTILEACKGVIVTSDSCFTVDNSCVDDAGNCESDDENYTYFEKQIDSADESCLNGGVFNPSISSCQCVGGWIGPTCQKLARNCLDLQDDESYPDNRYDDVALDPYGNGSHIIPRADCHLSGGDSKASLLINGGDGDLLTGMTPETYLNGYRSNAKVLNVWLGTEHAYHLVAAGHALLELQIKVNDPNTSVVSIRQLYQNFSMEGLAFMYAFNFLSRIDLGPPITWEDGEVWTMGDCLSESVERPFSMPNELRMDLAFGSGTDLGWWYPEDIGDVTFSPFGYEYGMSRSNAEEYFLITGLDLANSAHSTKVDSIRMYLHYTG